MINEHENDELEVEVNDFENAVIEDPEPDPEPDPEQGNEDNGGNEADGEDQEEETPTDENPEKEPAEESKEGFVDIEDDARIEVDGKPVLYKELVAKYKNDKEWQKANTTKAQEIADQRKSLDRDILAVSSIKGLVNLVKENPAVISSLKEFFSGNQEALVAIDKALTADPSTLATPYEQQINELQGKLQLIEAEKAFKTQENDCKTKYQLTDTQIKEVSNIIIDEYNKSKATLSHETAYKLWRAENFENQKPMPPEKPKGKNVASNTPRKKGLKGPYGGDYDATVDDFAEAIK